MGDDSLRAGGSRAVQLHFPPPTGATLRNNTVPFASARGFFHSARGGKVIPLDSRQEAPKKIAEPWPLFSLSFFLFSLSLALALSLQSASSINILPSATMSSSTATVASGKLTAIERLLRVPLLKTRTGGLSASSSSSSGSGAMGAPGGGGGSSPAPPGTVSTATLSGKVVFLYVSAGWCPACKDTTPKLAKLYREMKALNEKSAAQEAAMPAAIAPGGGGQQQVADEVQIARAAGAPADRPAAPAAPQDPAVAAAPAAAQAAVADDGDDADAADPPYVPPFEVVFVSLDRNDKGFDEYFQTMPNWLAVPFAYEKQRRRIAALCNARSIPTLAIVNELGELVSTRAMRNVHRRDLRKQFPWIPPNVSAVLQRCHFAARLPIGDEKEMAPSSSQVGAGRRTADDAAVAAAVQRDLDNEEGESAAMGNHKPKPQTTSWTDIAAKKYVVLYFAQLASASCRAFTPKLRSVYRQLQAKDDPTLQQTTFLFVGIEGYNEPYNAMWNELPFNAVAFRDPHLQDLLSACHVRAVPWVTVVRTRDGKILGNHEAGIEDVLLPFDADEPNTAPVEHGDGNTPAPGLAMANHHHGTTATTMTLPFKPLAHAFAYSASRFPWITRRALPLVDVPMSTTTTAATNASGNGVPRYHKHVTPFHSTDLLWDTLNKTVSVTFFNNGCETSVALQEFRKTATTFYHARMAKKKRFKPTSDHNSPTSGSDVPAEGSDAASQRVTAGQAKAAAASVGGDDEDDDDVEDGSDGLVNFLAIDEPSTVSVGAGRMLLDAAGTSGPLPGVPFILMSHFLEDLAECYSQTMSEGDMTAQIGKFQATLKAAVAKSMAKPEDALSDGKKKAPVLTTPSIPAGPAAPAASESAVKV